MRATIARCAIVAATVLVLSGCRSGANSSGWTWGRKNPPAGTALDPNSGPQLPSASATPPNYAPAYSNATTPPVATGYPNPAGAVNPYQATPYAGQPAGFNNAVPGGATPGVGAPAGSYAAVPGGGAPYGGAPAGSVAPQTGPYNENYGQPAATGSAYGAVPDAANAYQSQTPQGAYQPPYGQPADAGQVTQAPAADPYGTAVPPASSPNGASQADPNAAGSYQTADNRYADRYGAGAAPVQPEQTNADRYAAANQAAGDPATPDPNASGDRYQPANTPYQPGNTGYSPPGVPPYQTPSPITPSTLPRREPNYRPGGTSDYVPAGGTQASGSTPVDRYSTPAANPNSASYDPYAAPPAGQAPAYQPPNGGH